MTQAETAVTPSLHAFLQQHGFPLCPIDNEYHRFDYNGGRMNGSFHGETFTCGDKIITVVRCKDWRTDETLEWRSLDGETLSDQERANLEEKLAQAREASRLAKESEQNRVALDCEALWEKDCNTLGVSPYFRRKQLGDGLFGCRLRVTSEGILTALPARDISGKLWGIQYIHENGDKRFTRGMRIKGCFHQIGLIDPGGVIYVCEGIATGASVHLSTGSGVICGFNAGNLESVCRTLRGHYGPGAKIIVAGDDDRWTKRRDGSPWNPGREKALSAAEACEGRAVFPWFLDLASRPSDWCDLHALEGLERVKAQLEALPEELPPERGAGRSPSGIERMVLKRNKDKKIILPLQQQVAEHVLKYFGENIVKQKRELFFFSGTHWKLMGDGETDRIKSLIQHAVSGLGTASYIDACYKLFVWQCPAVPDGVDLHAPHAFAANFKNGTLFLVRGPDFKYRLDFRTGHRRTDYLTNLLPYDYREASEYPANAEFEGMLQRVFEGDPHIDQQIEAVAQMYGACLLPAFPRLFMLHGAPGTGKSSVINVAKRLVHKDNLCSVPPNQWHGFNMEGMAGKLVNADTDIPLNEPLTDEIVKKVIERQPFRIRRKGIRDIDAPIPSIHLFGGNGIPKTLDGGSGAHTRRWTFIEFTAHVPKGQYHQEYWDYCFEQGPEGVLAFALRGLESLVQRNGHFLVPDPSAKAVESWQDNSDPVRLFLAGARTGEILDGNSQIIVSPERRIERKNLWNAFNVWHQAEYGLFPKLGRTLFYDAIRRNKITERKTVGYHYFLGIGVEIDSDAKF